MAQNVTSQQVIRQGREPEKDRIALLKFIIICIPLWVSIKFYAGPFQSGVQFYLSCILFIIIWGLLLQMILPKLNERALLIALFLIFSAIELTAWQIPTLFAGIRVDALGNNLMGETFSLNKIPYYGVGAFIGFFILKACRKK